MVMDLNCIVAAVISCSESWIICPCMNGYSYVLIVTLVVCHGFHLQLYILILCVVELSLIQTWMELHVS
jgi:hypothetical protein